MINLKNNLYFAGVLALCILVACSSDAPSTAGSTTIPNASAQNDSIIFEGGKPIIPGVTDLCYTNQGSNTATLCGAYYDTTFYEKIVMFNTESTSLSSDVDSLDIKVYSEEKGATAICSVGDQSFDAKFKISSSIGYILKRLTMHNVGTACDSILHEFQKTCNTNPKIEVIGGFNGFCTSRGDLYAFCADFSTMECSEAGPDGIEKCHVALDSSTAFETNRFIQEFVQKTESVCSDITNGKFDISDFVSREDYWTPGHNPVDYLSSSSSGELIDTASFTLEKYEKLFAEPEKEYKFDEHVIAYRVLPSSEVVIDTNSPLNGLTIREASPAEIAKYFPMTSAITGDKFNPEFCLVYTITATWAYLSEASILTYLDAFTIKFALLFAGGKCQKDSTGFAEIFLVKDCDGVIYEDPGLDGDLYDSPWTCNENGIPTGRENGPYGEWIRADLLK